MSEEDFVTVVSVEDAPYVTVVEVQEPLIRTPGTEETSAVPPHLQEDIQIYRLPGERLGFGLKFDGGTTVSSLTVESTAEGSPSARARASWGPLAPGDCILAVDGRPVAEMSRQEVVTRLTESGLVVKLRIGRGAPPVPPRRQCKRRLPGPPPPPRPLPRAPPRLVDFLPKDCSRPIEAPAQESDMFKNTLTATLQETDDIDGKDLYIGKEVDSELQIDGIQLEDDLKEKIIPLKNLNPKLISLFEHSQPSDNIVKTSQNPQFHNNKKFWSNDDKSRKSVKDKIALFSSEVENNFENKPRKLEFNERNDVPKKAQKVLEMASVPVSQLETNNNLCNRVNISENCGIIDEKDNLNQIDENIDVKPTIVPLSSQNMAGAVSGDNNVVSFTVNSVPSPHKIQFKTKEKIEDKQNENIKLKDTSKKADINLKVNCNSNVLPEPRIKFMTCKEKTCSKLRGLVIPQTPSEIPSTEQILDLPEIKSSTLFIQPELLDNMNVTSKQEELCNINISDSNYCLVKPKFQSTVTIHKPNLEWNPHFENELPKYSPAFKRKALSVFEIRSNSADNHLNDSEKSQPMLGRSWYFLSNTKEESKVDSNNISKETISTDDKEEYSTPLNSPEHEVMDTEFKICTTTKGNVKKDDFDLKTNANCSVIPKENNSEPNSLTSHNSLSSTTVEHEKSKHFQEGKLDSLLSQDMSDSGNHSIPSNCSKYKSDSSDESLSSLVNSDLDHASLNCSSDEGHFLEFSYNNRDTKNEEPYHNSKDVIPKTLTSLTNYLNKTKSLTDSLVSATSFDNEERMDVDNKAVSLPKNIQDDSNTWKDEKAATIMDKLNDDSENTNLFPIKLSLNGHINHSTLSQCKPLELKEYNNDTLPKDSIIDENIISLNSPVGDLQKENHFASITSLASSTSLISHQELCQLIEESNDSSMDDNNGTPDISVIVLHRDSAEGSIGITLAGGVDYECKDIMVHKVLCGSPADKDGRIKKGHRILSINGKSMKGLTHAESLAVLKAPRHEVVLVVARSQGYLFEENNNVSRNALHHSAELNSSPAPSHQTGGETKWGPVITVILLKEGAGLGFSLKGGKDSPSGDQALTVQKIFTGGCAEKSKQIFAGDELLSINEYDLNGMTRVEAWTLMKRLPDGKVTLKIRHSAH